MKGKWRQYETEERARGKNPERIEMMEWVWKSREQQRQQSPTVKMNVSSQDGAAHSRESNNTTGGAGEAVIILSLLTLIIQTSRWFPYVPLGCEGGALLCFIWNWFPSVSFSSSNIVQDYPDVSVRVERPGCLLRCILQSHHVGFWGKTG